MEGDQPTSGLRHRAIGSTPGRALLTIVVALSCLALAPVQPAAAETNRAEDRLESFKLPSPLVDPSAPGGQLADGRTIPKVNVLLPEGYDKNPSRRYPVLWLLHGAFGGADNWLPGIADLAEGFPGIIVMPDGGRFSMYTNWWNGGVRGDPAWATYHLQDLRRVVERRYRIRPGRRWHAIGGISMGGQGALRYAATLPGYFGSVATLSAALPDMQAEVTHAGVNAAATSLGGGITYEAIFGPRAGAYAEGNSPQPLTPNLSHTRIYLTSGNGINCPQDPVNPATIALDTGTEAVLNAQQAPFAAGLRAAGADVTAVTTCGIHTFGVWDRAFPAVFAWRLFEPVKERPRRWTYRTVATAGDMWGLRFRFAEPPSAVAEFNRSGDTLTATGSGQVRIRGPRGCRLNADLPFERRLPPACLRSP